VKERAVARLCVEHELCLRHFVILGGFDQVGQLFVVCVRAPHEVEGATTAGGEIKAKVLETLGRSVLDAGR